MPSRAEFENLLERFKSRFDGLTWRAWHSKLAPETTDVEIELGWIDCYVILTPYADQLWVWVDGATFESLPGAEAPEFFESLFSDRVVKTHEKDGSLAELRVLGEGVEWISG